MPAMLRAAPILIVMTALAVFTYIGSHMPAAGAQELTAPDRDHTVLGLWHEAEAWEEHRQDGNYELLWARYADLDTQGECTFADFVRAEQAIAADGERRLTEAISSIGGKMASTESKSEQLYQQEFDLPLPVERRNWSLGSGRWQTRTSCGA